MQALSVIIEPSMTLAEVVDAHPQLAREFEQRGLDYCCGGGRSIADSCALGGLDLALTIAELVAATDSPDAAEWATMTAEALVDHLETTHHRYLKDEMPRLSALIGKIVSVHGARHPELRAIAECFADIRTDLEPHMHREEQVLFPMIRELVASATVPTFPCGTLGNPITVMMREHDAVGDLLVRLHSLTGRYEPPADGCASYRTCFAALAEFAADTHLHIHKENNVLFPMVMQLEADRAAMSR